MVSKATYFIGVHRRDKKNWRFKIVEQRSICFIIF